MALPPSFYNVGDQAIYTGGQHYIPQEQYRLGYYPPVTEEEQLTTATGVGIPYTNAFTNSGAAAGGGGGGPGNYEKTWTRENRPVEPKWITNPVKLTDAEQAWKEGPFYGPKQNIGMAPNTLDDSIRVQALAPADAPPGYFEGSIEGELDYTIPATSQIFDPNTAGRKQYQTPRTIQDQVYFQSLLDKEGGVPPEEETGIWQSIKAKLFQPKYRETLGDRLAAQYQTSQKLPFFLRKVAALQSPFNPDSKNYNEHFADQLNYLEGLDNYIGKDPQSGLYKYDENSVLAGQNVFSGFGSNDYEEQLAKQLGKYQETWDTKSDQWDEAKKARWRAKFLDKAKTEMEAWKNRNQDTTDIVTDTITTDDQTTGEGGVSTFAGDSGAKAGTTGSWTPGGTYSGGDKGQHTTQAAADKAGESWKDSPFAQGGRAGFKPGGPAGGASAGGDYGGNVNPEQEYAGRTFQETYGGDGNKKSNTGGITQLVEDKNVVDVDWLTPEPNININLDRSKYLAQLDLINSIKNQELEGQIGAKIGPVDFTTMINEGDIGNTNINYDNWSANFDPNANLQNISYANNIGGWDVGGSYYPEGQNLMFNISKTFKHGGLARLL